MTRALEDCDYTCTQCRRVVCRDNSTSPLDDHNICTDCITTDLEITEPGIYYGLPADVYRAQHSWLSWSRMKNLIPPLTPAHFKAALDQPEERKRNFDLGKVVHRLTLGDGDDFEVVQALNKHKQPYDAVDYTTVSAKTHRDLIYAAGKVPILRDELDQAQAMADQVQAHPAASRLFAAGHAEVSLFWLDPETGVKCRARLDWMPNPVAGRRIIIPDLKTTADVASPTEFSKAAARYGYYGQAHHYSDGVQALTGQRPAFVFVTVETRPPHLVGVSMLTDRDDLRLARNAVDHCRRLYGECLAANRWPGHSDDVADLHLPAWLHYQLEDVIAS